MRPVYIHNRTFVATQRNLVTTLDEWITASAGGLQTRTHPLTRAESLSFAIAVPTVQNARAPTQSSSLCHNRRSSPGRFYHPRSLIVGGLCTSIYEQRSNSPPCHALCFIPTTMSRQELPLFTAVEFTFLVATTVVEADKFVQTLTASAAAPANVFGFDVELTPCRAVRLVQIASREQAYVFDISLIGCKYIYALQLHSLTLYQHFPLLF